MNRSKQISSNNTYGLYLNGTISDRTRRHVPKDNPTTEIVTYTVSDNGGASSMLMNMRLTIITKSEIMYPCRYT